MNGNKTVSSTPLSQTTVFDKDKKWQNELLMERLKSKSTQHRTFQEMSKAMRMALLEKRYALDHVEKANLQKCLDSMQHCIKVTSRQGLVERLESLTRQLGLKFMEDSSGLFISSDMFYLEIVLDANGIVQDVKVHHEGNIEQQSCEELVTCLVKGDFTDFTQQLEGLASIYQLNAEQKIKTKAFVALQALETDLTNLYLFQNNYKDHHTLLFKSAVGILQPRRGGHPMKLTYFVSPYDLIDSDAKTTLPLAIDFITTKNLGMSVTVNLEASGANKLQITPILMVNKDQQGRTTPVYSTIGGHNSTLFPASFVLRLNKPLPISFHLVQQIKHKTELEFAENSNLSPLLSLIVKHGTNGEVNSIGKGLFVSLPEQSHCYFVTNTKNLDGIVISSVPFTEPRHVPHILNFLRLQAAFNALISSCIRLKGKQDIENAIMFEISAISCQLIVVSLEHPFEESMATVEINLNDLTNIICKIYSLSKNYDNIAMKLSKVIQKCMSIPIAMRTLIKYWEQENQLLTLNGGNFNIAHGPNDPGGRSSGSGGGGAVNDLNKNIGNHSNIINSKNVGTNNIGSNNISSNNTSNRSLYHQNSNYGDHNLNSLFNSNDSNSMLNQDPLNFNSELSSSSKSAKKRRTNLMNEDFWKSPKSNNNSSNNETSEILLECLNNSSDSNSLGTSSVSMLSETGVATPNSNPCFPAICPDLEQLLSSDTRTMSDDCDLSDSEVSNKKKVSPIVNLTPISNNLQSVLTGMNLDLRTGIEILPFAASSQAQILPSSITITPINNTNSSSNSPSNTTLKSDSRKSSSGNSSSSKQRRSSSDDKRHEKKKKRKRDDSPMGPPEKLPPKPDPLNKPITVSIKTTDGAPVSPTNLLKKITSSSSPKSSGSNPIGGNNNSSNPTKQSPKNSPIYHGSPKHHSSGIHSPKSSSSPKHHTSSGSGKPSMSTLKSATNSPSSKPSEKAKLSSSSRDHRERSSSESRKSGNSSPKLKQSSVKLKQLDLSLLPSIELITNLGNCDPSNSSSTSPTDLNKLNSNRNRKSSLSAVIDKLKSAQNPPEDLPSPGGSSGNSNSNSSSSSKFQNCTNQSKDKLPSTPNLGKESKSSNNNNLKNLSLGSSSSNSNSSSNKNSEYMVKPSSDGIKITINKTRTKENKLSGSSSKSQSSFKSNSSGSKSKNSSSSSLQKSNSSGNLSSTLSSSKSSLFSSTKSSLSKTQSSGNLNASQYGFNDTKKDKSKQSSKLHHYRSHNETNDVMKILGFSSSSQSLDGFIKSFDTKKFQIPKLSARTNVTPPSNTNLTTGHIGANSSNLNHENNVIKRDVKTLLPTTNNSVIENDTTTKMLADLLTKEIPQKFPFAVNKIPVDNSTTKLASVIPTHSPTHLSQYPGHLTTSDLSYVPSKELQDKKHHGLDFTSVSLSEPPKLLNNILSDNATSKLMRPPSATLTQNLSIPKQSLDDKSILNEVLDFSSSASLLTTSRLTPPPSIIANLKENKLLPNSIRNKNVSAPSVSLHIVKSPVPSPLMVIPSPHSSSPCITDDELMDEALVGISGK